MKKIIPLLACILLTGIMNMKAQSPTPMQYLRQQNILSNNTPEAYFHLADSIMQIEYGTDSSEGGLMNGYRRWKQFFETRCAPVFDSIDITRPYHEALIYARSRGTDELCGEDQYKGAWENIGPRTDDKNIQNQGWVTAIWSEPGDYTHVIIGTLGAGVWKTTDGGNTWNNITDNTMPLGTFGVQSMTVNPNDYDDIYIAAQMFAKAPLGGDHVGMGVWHTTDGGATAWTMENIPTNPCIYSAATVLANDVEFCPYLVNGQKYVVLTLTNECDGEEVYGKLGTGSWTQLVNGVNGWNCRHFTDIEFMPDNQGKILISSEWPLGWALSPGVYTVYFNTTTGGAISPFVTALVDETLNGNQTLFCGNATGKALSFSVEYMGSGKIYMAYNWGYGSCTGAGVYRTNVAEFNYSTPNTITNLVSNMATPFLFHNADFEAIPNTNVMYLTLTQAIIIYKKNNVWSWNAVSEYIGDLKFHGDLRSLHIAHGQVSSDPDKPGYDDIVYWGNDGGLSRTWHHDVTKFATPNNATFIATSRDVENMNGANLYLGNLWDADKEPLDKGYSAGGWDNGIHYYNKAANVWTGSYWGDGMDGNFDKRFSDGTDYTLVEHQWSDINRHITPGAAYNAGASVGQPEPMNQYWRPHPMQYRKDIMNMGQIRAWESNSSTNVNPYFNGGASPNFNLIDLPNNNNIYPMCLRWKIDKLFCKQFMVTPSDDNRAYYLLFGAKKQGLLNKGIKNGTWDWVSGGIGQGDDITPSQIATLGFPGTDFCVDDKDADRIFLALGGIESTPGTNRVLISEDGGATWNDMSTGLTQLPVNCLVYQNGSNDVIYAGTDDGAYYWDATLLCWIKMNGSVKKGKTIPNIMITKLRINYCTRKLVAATFGRGVWESDLYFPNFFPDPTEIITANTTWGDNLGTITNKLIEGNILIKKPYTLTIEGIPDVPSRNAVSSTTTIFMPKWGQILVEKGAKLVVNGAHITNECNTNWMGIYCYGNGSVPQTLNPLNGLDDNHGWVSLYNAIIEHAEEAMNNGGGSNTPNTGGIIQTYDSHFINNHRSAAFYKYHNFMGTTLNPDWSNIKHNLFDYNDNARIGLYAHVSMWGVSDILVYDNIFNNTSTISTTNTSHQTAVLTLDAGPWLRKNEFNRFYKGVDGSQFSYSYENIYPLRITDNVFDKNEIGLHLSNVLLPEITNNDINIGHRQTSGGGSYYSLGAKMESVMGFKYSYNDHVETYNATYTAGTEVHNTGSNDENIDHNTYSGGLNIGNDGDYTCANITNDKFGLKYTCNINTDNTDYDFVFQANPYIRKTQSGATVNDATGNVFSSGTGVKSWYHFTGGNGPVNYVHKSVTSHTPNGGSFNYVPYPKTVAPCNNGTNFNIVKLDTSNYEELTEEEINSMKAYYKSNDSFFNMYNTLLVQLLDDGSTPTLVTQIKNSTISEQLTTRADFLRMSPYVTRDALTELAISQIVSQPILLEILLANPDATRDRSFITFLEEKIELPAYMVEMIQASWTGPQSARNLLELNVSTNHNDMTILKNNILRTYLINNSQRSKDSVYIWLQKMPSIRNAYEIIEFLLYEGEIADANSLLADLPVTFKMAQRDSVEHTAFINLYNFKKNLLENAIGIDKLDSARIVLLKEIADAEEYTFPRSMARNVLCFFYHICYPDTVRELPVTGGKAPYVKKNTERSKDITVYPNPANDYVVCYYNFLSKMNKAKEFIVSDIMGKQIYKVKLTGIQGQHIWDTRNVGNGNYIYMVTTDSGEKYSGKLTIQK